MNGDKNIKCHDVDDDNTLTNTVFYSRSNNSNSDECRKPSSEQILPCHFFRRMSAFEIK